MGNEYNGRMAPSEGGGEDLAKKQTRNGVPPEEAPPNSAVAAANPAPSVDLTGKRILVADDEANIRALLRDLLEEQGFEIAEAETGAQVIKALADGNYDLIMMDIKMPEMDGMAVLREM